MKYQHLFANTYILNMRREIEYNVQKKTGK